MGIKFESNEVKVEPIPPPVCDDCGQKTATHYVWVYFRSADIRTPAGGSFCFSCAKLFAERLSRSLSL